MLHHLLNCQMIDRIKLPVYFFTTSITTTPMTIDITINAIPETDEEMENVIS